METKSNVQKWEWEYNDTARQLFTDFKKTCDSFRREVMYDNRIMFGVPLQLIRLIKMCLNKTCSKVCM
jgi:hypothetical protein